MKTLCVSCGREIDQLPGAIVSACSSDCLERWLKTRRGCCYKIGMQGADGAGVQVFATLHGAPPHGLIRVVVAALGKYTTCPENVVPVVFRSTECAECTTKGYRMASVVWREDVAAYVDDPAGALLR